MASYILARNLLKRIVTREKECSPKIKEQKEKKNVVHIKVTSKSSVSASDEWRCRACARSACTPLRETLGDGDVMSALRSVSNLQISLEDKLPQYICSPCLARLRAAFDFQRQCQATDRQLRRALPSSGLNNMYPYSRLDFKKMIHGIQLRRAKEEEKKQKKQEKIERKKRKESVKEERAPKFKCPSCKLCFLTKDEQTRHRRERACVRHPCHVCGRLVIRLQEHLRAGHADRAAHECRVCGKHFATPARLRIHLRVHEDTFNFHCALCPYKSKHKHYLVMHMRTHTGERPHACDLCPALFVNPSNLNKHRLTHALNQFACEYCDKSYRTKVTLRDHQLATHMRVKHVCTLCSKGFSYRSDLRKHEIRHHNRAKRDFRGGEPTYAQVERIQRENKEQLSKDTTLDGATVARCEEAAIIDGAVDSICNELNIESNVDGNGDMVQSEMDGEVLEQQQMIGSEVNQPPSDDRLIKISTSSVPPWLNTKHSPAPLLVQPLRTFLYLQPSIEPGPQ